MGWSGEGREAQIRLFSDIREKKKAHRHGCNKETSSVGKGHKSHFPTVARTRSRPAKKRVPIFSPPSGHQVEKNHHRLIMKEIER